MSKDREPVGSIFAWRTDEQGLQLGFMPAKDRPCFYCDTPLQEVGGLMSVLVVFCPLCGWYYEWENVHPPHTMPYVACNPEERASVLRVFDAEDPQLAVDELCVHLKHSFSDLHCLSWRRFEEVAEAVFSSHGFSTVLTQQSNDGGADILILRSDQGETDAIIECKKYSPERKVGVSVVRSLVGAAVAWGVKKAVLITSSDFTRGVRESTEQYLAKGFEIDLVAASELAELLGVYNSKLPPLYKLTPAARREIARENMRRDPLGGTLRSAEGTERARERRSTL